MDSIQWQMDSEDIKSLEAEFESPWRIRDLSPLSRMIEWIVNSSNPLIGSDISGSFIPNGAPNSDFIQVTFRFHAKDYGDESGIPNSISKEPLRLLAIRNQKSLSFKIKKHAIQ